MFIIFTFILLVYFSVYANTQNIEVLSSGIMRLKKTDMVVIFFLTVRYNGQTPARAIVTVVQCCEKVSEAETDCDLIDLHGGDYGTLKPGSKMNFTLIYPNLYGFNRKGYCVVSILHRCLGSTETKEVNHVIEFDTTLSGDAVPSALEGWYDPETFTKCETLDQDPFDSCNPVDCALKYSGNKNYYNRKWKMCQRVPICKGDPNKEFPDVAYIPTSNVCRNLDQSITKEEVDLISKNKLAVKCEKDSKVNIRCHHGEIDPKTGLCKCDQGWKSEPFDPESYNPATSIYSMCNIRCVGHREDTYQLLPFFVGIMLSLWLFLGFLLCEKRNFFCRRKEENFVSFPPKPRTDEYCSLTSKAASTKENCLSSVSTPAFSTKAQDEESSWKPPKSIRGSSKSKTSFLSSRNT